MEIGRVCLYADRLSRPPGIHRDGLARKVQEEDAMVTITDKAAAKVQEIAEAEALIGQGLRLRVVGGGCAGFTYDLFFEDKPTDMDEQFEDKGIKLFVDPLSYQYLDGTEIDYVESTAGAGFKFINPNTKSTCGCGSSFSA
ncbi:MAG: iron-sulfur cluster insertion protein ErpA [Polyangiaceae bacterium]